ncbi:MAG: OOP family OmpA-OmpF porin [Kiritimatiellia bacterium]|jgi:OOP family OmpA-OmpF porin
MLFRALLPVCLLTLSSVAMAQDGLALDAHYLHPAALDGDLRSPLLVHRPVAFDTGAWYVGGLLEFANEPLVQRSEFSDGEVTRSLGLDDVLALNLGGGYAIHRNVRLQLAAPIYLTSLDADGRHGPAFGDVRLDGQFVLQQPTLDGAVGLGLQPFITFPTGPSARLLGDSGVTGGALLDATLERGAWTVSAGFGGHFAPQLTSDESLNLNGPDRLLTELGVGVLLKDNLAAHVETRMAHALSKNDKRGTGSPGELALSVRARGETGAWWTTGLSVPTTRGVGAASFRLFVGGGFGKTEAKPKDPDGDGLFGKSDACPDQPETFNKLNDEDGCPDGLPGLLVSVLHDGQAIDGADVDLSGPDVADHFTSTVDAHRREVMPNTTWTAKATKGACLEGTAQTTLAQGDSTLTVELQPVASATIRVAVVNADGQPIPSARLAWTSPDSVCVPRDPNKLDKSASAEVHVGPGTHTLLATAPDYRITKVLVDVSGTETTELRIVLGRTKIKVEKSRIVILEKVHFETNRAVIKPTSFELLNEVSDTIHHNPQIGDVEIAGHTDSQGSNESNKDLSQRRARAVVAYLIGHGVNGDRLLPMGYGETRPIDVNTTRSGRANNRRVEFNIIDKPKK